MKKHLFIILIFTSYAFALEVEIDALKKAIPTGDPGTINKALVDLHIAITYSDISDGSSYNNPSATRLDRRSEISQALEPIKQDLIALTSLSNPTVFNEGVLDWNGKPQGSQQPDLTIITNANVLLGYAQGSERVYETLIENVSQGSAANVVSSASYSLFQSGLADKKAIDIIIKRMEGYQDERGKEVAYRLMHLAGVWPMPSALDLFTEVLKSKSPISAKIVAANAIAKIGAGGASALPSLRDLLQELEQNGGDFRDINTINRAIMLASGRSNTPQAVMPSTTAAQTTPAPPLPVQQPKSEATPSIKIEVETPSSSSFPILPVAILAAVIVGIVLYILRRKSK